MDNEAHLHHITGGDPFVYRELIRHFISTTASDMHHLETATLKKDISNIRHFAHRIKGSAQLFLVQSLADSAAVMEKATQTTSIDELYTCYKNMHNIFLKIKQKLLDSNSEQS